MGIFRIAGLANFRINTAVRDNSSVEWVKVKVFLSPGYISYNIIPVSILSRYNANRSAGDLNTRVKKWPLLQMVMPQSHHTPGSRTGCSRAVLNKNYTSTHRGPVQPNTTLVRDFCQLWFCQLPYVSVRAPYGTLAGPARAPYGFRRI